MKHLTPTLSVFATGRAIAPLWVAPNGRAFYPIAGGAPDDPPADPPADPPKPKPSDPPADPGKTFTEADVERIIAGRLSKYADYDDVKAERDRLVAEGQTESEKAIAAAKAEGGKEARVEGGKLLALEVFNGAAALRNPEHDTTATLELIDLGKFVGDDGAVDREAIKKAVEQVVPEKQGDDRPPSFGGGPRKSDKPEPAPGRGRLRMAYENSTTK